MPPSSAAKLAWCAAAPLLAFAYLELAVAAFKLAPARAQPITVWTPTMDRTMEGDQAEYRFDPVRLWEPRPGALFVNEPINVDGYRGPVHAKTRSAALRIVTLGESTTFGMHVPDADSWPRQLERRLRERGVDVEVLNFGVIGHSVVQGLATYGGRVREYRPDIVIACFGGLNEHFPCGGLDDASKLELFAMPGFQTRVFLERFGGVRWLTSLIAAHKEPTNGDAQRVSPEQYRDALLELRAETQRDGVELVLVAPPVSRTGRANTPQIAAYFAQLESTCASAKIPLARADLAVAKADDALPEAERSTSTPSKLFHDPWHPWGNGHALCAAAIEATLESSGALAHRAPADSR